MDYNPFGFEYTNQSLAHSYSTVTIQQFRWYSEIKGWKNDMAAGIIGVDQTADTRSQFGYVYPMSLPTAAVNNFIGLPVGVIQGFNYLGNDLVQRMNAPSFTPLDQYPGSEVTVNVISDPYAIFRVQSNGSAIPVSQGSFYPYEILTDGVPSFTQNITNFSGDPFTVSFIQGNNETGVSLQGIVAGTIATDATNLKNTICTVVGLSQGIDGNEFGEDNLIFDVILNSPWLTRNSAF